MVYLFFSLSIYQSKKWEFIPQFRHNLWLISFTMRTVLKADGREAVMYFNVYVDSFLILQFVMNLFMLSLTNSMMKQKVRRRRMVEGAMGGAVCALFPMLLPFRISIRMGFSFVLSVLSMIVITFRINRFKNFCRIMEKTAISTLLLGGLSMLIFRFIPKGKDTCLGLAMVLAVVGGAFWFLKKIICRRTEEDKLCRVILSGTEQMVVDALIDTGNSLTEPISGKPVSVLDKAVFNRLFQEKPENYRVIPYHSIGRKRGILPGYLLQSIIVETQEGQKEYKEVYVGISEEILADSQNYKMILNPRIME